MKRLVLLLAVLALPAHAYNEALHALITRRALASKPGMNGEVKPPDVHALRAKFFALASANPEFHVLFPTEASFGPWEFKELVLLDPAATVHGFDDVPGPATRLDLWAAASRWPDDDERNRHRYLRDPKTQDVVLASDGQPMPYDPATLDFGSLTGTTSQGHAHYGLVDGPLSDDPEVLKRDPRRFAVPPTAHAYGREFAQLYTDLALLAAGDEALQITFAGAALHHIEDVCNQIHTVQVGIYEFFESAFFQSKLRDVKTLGGLFGERRTLKQVGLRLIANHHLVSEDLYAARVLAGLGWDEHDDPDVRGSGPRFAEALTSAIIERSSLEGPEIYRLAWRFTAPTLRDGSGHEYDGAKDDPAQFVNAQAPELPRFYDVQGRGMRRATTAVRVYFDALAQADRSPQAAVDRILALALPYRKAAAARRAAYVPAGPERLGIAWGYPAAAALLLACAGLWLVRRRARAR